MHFPCKYKFLNEYDVSTFVSLASNILLEHSGSLINIWWVINFSHMHTHVRARTHAHTHTSDQAGYHSGPLTVLFAFKLSWKSPGLWKITPWMSLERWVTLKPLKIDSIICQGVFICLIAQNVFSKDLILIQLISDRNKGKLIWLVKAVYCHPAYLTYMQSIVRTAGLEEAQAGIKIARRQKKKKEEKKRLPGEISITSDTQMTPPLWQKVKRN